MQCLTLHATIYVMDKVFFNQKSVWIAVTFPKSFLHFNTAVKAASAFQDVTSNVVAQQHDVIFGYLLVL